MQIDWNKVFDILKESCGAHEFQRNHFIYHQKEWVKDGQTFTEYRIEGNLGFGGKFKTNLKDLYVSCYSEDMNEERAKMISAANHNLKILVNHPGMKCPCDTCSVVQNW